MSVNNKRVFYVKYLAQDVGIDLMRQIFDVKHTLVVDGHLLRAFSSGSHRVWPDIFRAARPAACSCDHPHSETAPPVRTRAHACHRRSAAAALSPGLHCAVPERRESSASSRV